MKHGSILVTGATGFFGRAFVKRALETEIAHRVCIFSRDEFKQAQMRAAFNDDSRLRWFVGDVRDLPRLRRAMEGVETVIHAAALKRVEVGEYNPDELVKTNILGAMNLIEAAQTTIDGYLRPRNVVALSTDKAASPINAYGSTKLCAEKLFLAANNMRGHTGPRFAVTRYGNVWNSTGSVVPTWKRMMADGKRIRVTNPEATRFFMTIDEAVDLVLKAVGLETLVVPNLPAYRLGDLAEAMGGEIEITGMGPGEKLHEAMVSEDEVGEFFMVGNHWERAPEIAEGRLETALTSDRARRMSVQELREKLSAL